MTTTNRKAINGQWVGRDGVWMWTATECNCDHCKTFITTAVAEARLNRSTWAKIEVRHGNISNLIEVENWSK